MQGIRTYFDIYSFGRKWAKLYCYLLIEQYWVGDSNGYRGTDGIYVVNEVGHMSGTIMMP